MGSLRIKNNLIEISRILKRFEIHSEQEVIMTYEEYIASRVENIRKELVLIEEPLDIG